MKWIPLHVHSQYSILDATASVDAIVNKASQFGMTSVALTDHGNLFGAVDFYKKCKGQGINPIIGCELYVAPRSRFDKKKNQGEKAAFHLVALAKNRKGYRNLCKLSSLAYQEGFYYKPRVDKELLAKYCDGIICLSACLSGVLARHVVVENFDELKKEALWYREVFGDDFFVELQRHPVDFKNMSEEGIDKEEWLKNLYVEYSQKCDIVNDALLDISKELSLPYVATTDSHYVEKNEWRAHEILLNVQSGEPCEMYVDGSNVKVPNPNRRVYHSNDFYFKSSEDMEKLFSDIPEAISNASLIAGRCGEVLDFDKKFYPAYEIPSNNPYKATDTFEYLKALCLENVPKRYTAEQLNCVKKKLGCEDPRSVVFDRLVKELEIIRDKNLSDYILIVSDFIRWAKVNDIPIGPGRGSGAGSVILYLAEITNIEPLRFGLLFERFLNPERFSYPDIDVDICMDNRDRVIGYILEKYGSNNVAQIITFGTMKAKTAIRDVGRVLNVPLSKVNGIVKLISDELNITINKALEMDQELRDNYLADEDTKKILDLAKSLEGNIRNIGMHASGIVISSDDISDNVPVCISKDSKLAVTQYAMKALESVGMLKVDFLGLRTLTVIKSVIDTVRKFKKIEIELDELPLDDEKTFALLNSGKTLTVFQLESGGIRNLCKQLHVDVFDEIAAVVSLYRPGPMDMIPSFVNRKHNKEPIEYLHPLMESILSETYGIIVYQEQVIQISQKLAGFSLSEGDVLRYAMGKKVATLMADIKKKFIDGCIANGIIENVAIDIFDLIEKFASYGFNKSHGVSYAYITYITAYLKANFPVEWMASFISHDSGDTDKVYKYIKECKDMQIAVLPPDVNKSYNYFAVEGESIRFSLTAIKGVGEGVVSEIISCRESGGSFRDLYNFLDRMYDSGIGKKVVETLVFAGCFDFSGLSRDKLVSEIDPMQKSIAKKNKNKAIGALNMFELIDDDDVENFGDVSCEYEKFTSKEIIFKEKELTGVFFTENPLMEYDKFKDNMHVVSLADIDEMDNGSLVSSFFIVENVKIRFSSKMQKKFAIITISDGDKSVEVPIWATLYEKYHQFIEENQMVYGLFKLEKGEEKSSLSCLLLMDCDSIDENTKIDNIYKSFPKNEKVMKDEFLEIDIDLSRCEMSDILVIKEMCAAHSGKNNLVLNFVKDGDNIYSLSARNGVCICEELKKSLEEEKCVLSVKSAKL